MRLPWNSSKDASLKALPFTSPLGLCSHAPSLLNGKISLEKEERGRSGNECADEAVKDGA